MERSDRYAWFDEFCLSQAGATKDYKPEWSAARYLVREKMFAMHGGDKYGKPILTLKLDPAFGSMLRQQYPDIVPGYYMNKTHWNSLYLDGDVPDDVVKDMIVQSYTLILHSLSKSVQQEIQKEETTT